MEETGRRNERRVREKKVVRKFLNEKKDGDSRRLLEERRNKLNLWLSKNALKDSSYNPVEDQRDHAQKNAAAADVGSAMAVGGPRRSVGDDAAVGNEVDPERMAELEKRKSDMFERYNREQERKRLAKMVEEEERAKVEQDRRADAKLRWQLGLKKEAADEAGAGAFKKVPTEAFPRRGERKMIDGVGFVKKVEFEALQLLSKTYCCRAPAAPFQETEVSLRGEGTCAAHRMQRNSLTILIIIFQNFSLISRCLSALEQLKEVAILTPWSCSLT